jgi:tripartite-type tricarboxylate transporter receptor subunit TctC
MMNLKSSKMVGLVLVVGALFFLNGGAAWAKYPEKPINGIMCWSAGGTIDLTFRPLATAAGKIMGQPFIIETRPGGSGSVGMGLLKTRKPDGYNVAASTISTLIHQHMNRVPFNLVKDFTPILQYSDAPYGIAVKADSPWKTFKDFVDYAKANPGKVRFGSSGPGDPGGLLTMSTLAERFQVDWTHIPFEGAMPALSALLGGHLEAYAATLGIVKSNILSGRLRLIVGFGEKRLKSFPDVPTLKELGTPFVAPSFSAVWGPKGLPPEIHETLHQAFRKAMDDPDFLKSLDITEKGWVYKNPADTAKEILRSEQLVIKILGDMKKKKK